VVGAQLRVPLLRNGHVEVVPNGDITFLTRVREYGVNVDAVYVSGGSRGGMYFGGGLAVRNSIFSADAEGTRETSSGLGIVVGAKAGGPGGLGTQIEFRWVFLPDLDYDPRAITLGLNVPLWGWSRDRDR
jgi:hypothetical protein